MVFQVKTYYGIGQWKDRYFTQIMKTISIFFSTNKKYVPYLGVTIYSLLKNASLNYKYDIYVMHHELGQEDINSLRHLEIENSNISCIDVTKYLKGHHFYGGPVERTKHISQETFYRMLIPDVLPSNEKILYLDCDVVVLGDVAELYETDLCGNTIGAVYSVEHWTNDRKSNPPSDKQEWFNAGVMVVDLGKYRQNNYVERCKELMLDTTYETVDQDVLRIVANRDTFYLSYEWNVLWHHSLSPVNGLNRDNNDIYHEVLNAPKIVHYTTGVKPWNYAKGKLADIFWENAKQTEFYNRIVEENKNVDEEYIESNLNGFYVFPKDIVPKGSKIILYGAGRVGRSYYRQIEMSGWCEIVAWADKNINNIMENCVKRISLNEISSLQYDYILVAISKESIVDEVVKSLKVLTNDAQILWNGKSE